MLKDEKMPEIIVVNNNYEKMAKKKASIINTNNLAIKNNNDINRAKKTNMALSVIISLVVTVALCAAIWFYADISIVGLPVSVSKMILSGVVAICVFAISNNLLSISRYNLDKNRKSILTIGESVNFTTFLNGKTAKSYSLTAYSETPYAAQPVYLTLVAEDENGKISEYSSMNKWSLILLPLISDVIIDAENITIYVPCENNEDAGNQLKNQISQEHLRVEREARENAEKQLSLVISEKEAVERVLFKNSATISELQRSLEDAKKKLSTADSRYTAEKSSLLITIENQKKENDNLSLTIESLNKTIAQQKQDCSTLNDKVQKLELDVASSVEEYNKLRNSFDGEVNEKLAEVSKKHVSELQSINDKYRNEIATLKADCETKLVAAENCANKERQLKDDALKSFESAESAKQKVSDELNEIRKLLIAANARSADLEKELKQANDALSKDTESVKAIYEDKITNLENQLSVTVKQNDTMLENIKRQHESELSALKDKFTSAAKAAKDSLEARHSEEIKSLKEENEKLASENNTEKMIEELNSIREALKKETATRTAREKELVFERDAIKTLEIKLKENDNKNNDKIKSILAEKEKVESELVSFKKACDKLSEEKASILASSGVQERALIKEKETLLAKIKTLEDKTNALGDTASIKKENEELKKQIELLRREDIEAVKRDCDDKLSFMREEKDKMEKKMREALESAAKEKAERIKGENILRQYMSDEKRTEYEKKMAEQEAEMAKAREKAEKAQQDAMRARSEETNKEERKRPSRHLIY